MAQIFISYRRDDSRETALQLLAALKPYFSVFMDVEGILVGKDFRATVERELLAAQVVLIVIGTQWVTITGKDGSRRLDKLDDLVRIEAEMALRHDKIVIPVLVNGATMPGEDDLPRSLSQLPFLNGEFLVPGQVEADTARLIRQIKRALGLEVEPTHTTVTVPSEPPPIKQIFRNTIWYTGVIVVGLGIIGLIGNLLIRTLNLSPTPTPMVVLANQPTLSDAMQIVGLTQTFEAVQTLTAIPTVTPTPTIDFNATVDAIATGTRAAQQTAEAAATLTAMPTRTPTLSPLQAAYATAAAYDYRVGNTAWSPITQDFDGVTMVLVPPGCFELSTKGSVGIAHPSHEQCFDRPFWIDRAEVKQNDFSRLGGQKSNLNGFDGGEYPVENITWSEARNFCRLRSSRLPSEIEWQYAAHGPDSLIYPWGNEWQNGYAVIQDNSGMQTAPVASIENGVSWVGAFDMIGNVAEFTAISGLSFVVVYGAGWNDRYPGDDHEAYTNSISMETISTNIGFRCTRDYEIP